MSAPAVAYIFGQAVTDVPRDLFIPPDALQVVLPAGDAAGAALLRELVQRELPVCALERVRTSLLESYQNTLNIQRDKL